ncbi:hypothetical protein Pint_13296 [Pistacia integerrima]|uniref:Uncharacterized protein n=1 Tax=Pistacia integerrima TaxID=434235 RepID=A0ACC0YAR0_9ROSI|nr:hypothetical protein Pint_13296 [Pistacia integerrima]
MIGSLNLLLAPVSSSPFLSLNRLSCFHSSSALSASEFSALYLWRTKCILSRLIDLLRATSRRLALATKASTITSMAKEEENAGNVKRQLAKLFDESLKATVPNEPDVEPLVAACTAKFGDYQCNNAMGLWSKIKGKGTEFRGPPAVGQAIMKNLPPSEMIESCSVAGPGFVNVVLAKNWIAKTIQKMLIDGIETWAPRLRVKKAVVDFSSPNIAKEMHVGHLRSTIIGDSLARMLEFSNVEVLRRNHVGDWGTQVDLVSENMYPVCGSFSCLLISSLYIDFVGTPNFISLHHSVQLKDFKHILQFGMLIEHLFEKFPNFEDVNETAIGDLQAFYKASKQRFDSDPAFKEIAQKAVVRLQVNCLPL